MASLIAYSSEGLVLFNLVLLFTYKPALNSFLDYRMSEILSYAFQPLIKTSASHIIPLQKPSKAILSAENDVFVNQLVFKSQR